MFKVFGLPVLFIFLAMSCTKQTSNIKGTDSTDTNTVVAPTLPPLVPTTPSNGSCSCPNGCASDPGVATAGQTIDYHTINGQKIVNHGAGTGIVVWSSQTDLPAGFNQNIFYTDAKLKIRVIPKRINSDPQSANAVHDSKGVKCDFNNPGMAFTKMRVGVSVRRTSDPAGSGYYHQFDNVPLDCPSSVYSFPVPQNSPDPLVIEIKNVSWDYTCSAYLQSGYYTEEELVQYGVCPWAQVWDHECYELELQMATDTTKDFP